jgi:hypothetical protein
LLRWADRMRPDDDFKRVFPALAEMSPRLQVLGEAVEKEKKKCCKVLTFRIGAVYFIGCMDATLQDREAFAL